MRRVAVALLIVLGVSLPAAAASAAPSRPGGSVVAAEGTPVTEQSDSIDTVDLSCAKPGVVRPNCGVKPQQAGDRGGALQYTVWGVLVAGLVVIFSVVFRSASRTNRTKTAEVGERNWS